MPLYDYQCLECKTEFQVRCGATEKSQKKECPACGSLNTICVEDNNAKV